MENNIESSTAVLAHQLLDPSLTLWPRNVLFDRDGTADRSDGIEINAKNEASNRNPFDGGLHPTSRGGAEIEDGARGAKEGVLGIELNELPCGPRTVTVLFGEVVVLVQTVLALHLPHLSMGLQARDRDRDFADNRGLGSDKLPRVKRSRELGFWGLKVCLDFGICFYFNVLSEVFRIIQKTKIYGQINHIVSKLFIPEKPVARFRPSPTDLGLSPFLKGSDRGLCLRLDPVSS